MATVRLLPKGKTKSILFLDGDTVGPVKNSDMAFFNVTDGADIGEEKTEEILLNCILPAGKGKALDLLGVADRTEKELHDRLSEAGYGESVISHIMDYVKQYPYLNDSRYAYNYLSAERRAFARFGRSLRRRESQTNCMRTPWRDILKTESLPQRFAGRIVIRMRIRNCLLSADLRTGRSPKERH